MNKANSSALKASLHVSDLTVITLYLPSAFLDRDPLACIHCIGLRPVRKENHSLSLIQVS